MSADPRQRPMADTKGEERRVGGLGPGAPGGGGVSLIDLVLTGINIDDNDLPPIGCLHV